MKDYVLAETAQTPLTLGELCRRCDLRADEVVELVEFGVIEPVQGRYPSDWRFTTGALVRVRRALRLQQDLQMNHAGVALALDLIEELRLLRARLHALDPDEY